MQDKSKFEDNTKYIDKTINDKSIITAMLAVNRKVFDNLFVAKLLNMS